jgi:gliding motility-associated lipoprotein GldH
MRKLFCLLFGLYLTSCSSSEDAVLNEIKVVSEKGWNINEPVSFEMDVADTAQLYDVFITLRHNTDYEWMNLFLFMKTYYPDKSYSRDTLECFLADESGRWFGKGGASIKYHEMLYKKYVKFPQEGHYTFEFTQGMRTKSLRNVMDLGIKLVKSQKPEPGKKNEKVKSEKVKSKTTNQQ